jgi:hypothetical protein
VLLLLLLLVVVVVVVGVVVTDGGDDDEYPYLGAILISAHSAHSSSTCAVGVVLVLVL